MDIQPRYIKSFSKGQITIPKEVRDFFDLKHDFWLKVYVKENKIIAEPLEKKLDKAAYKKRLLSLKGDVDISWEEILGNRKQIEDQIRRRAL